MRFCLDIYNKVRTSSNFCASGGASCDSSGLRVFVLRARCAAQQQQTEIDCVFLVCEWSTCELSSSREYCLDSCDMEGFWLEMITPRHSPSEGGSTSQVTKEDIPLIGKPRRNALARLDFLDGKECIDLICFVFYQFRKQEWFFFHVVQTSNLVAVTFVKFNGTPFTIPPMSDCEEEATHNLLKQWIHVITPHNLWCTLFSNLTMTTIT